MKTKHFTLIVLSFAGLSVDTTHNQPLTHRFKIHKMCEYNARQKTFDYNGENVTVEQYYLKRYNIRLE